MTISKSLVVYRALEALLGRALLWRTGRWLYQGARRQLIDDPSTNGEYALQNWVVQDQAQRTEKSVFFDVGSYRGAWTANLLDVIAAHELKTAKVVAFEPSPTMFERLRSRFKDRIAAGEVLVDARAMTAEEGRHSFETHGEGGTSRLTPAIAANAAGDSIVVQTTTIDHVMAELKIERIALLKIDAEGHDFNVIRGAARALAGGRIGVLQFEYTWCWIEYGCSMRNVFDFVDRQRYAIGLLTETGIEIYDVWHPELDRFIECNAVLINRDLIPALPHRVMTFNSSNVPVPAG